MKLKVLLLTGAIAVALTACGKKDEAAQAFFTFAIQGDASEMKLGELGAQMADSEAVRTFGETLRNDHRAHVRTANQAAANSGFTINEAPTKAANDEFDKLSKMSGAEFDDEFVAFMVDDHKRVIAEYEKATKSQNPDVSKLATDTLPVLRKHLSMGETLKGGGTPAPAAAATEAPAQK